MRGTNFFSIIESRLYNLTETDDTFCSQRIKYDKTTQIDGSLSDLIRVENHLMHKNLDKYLKKKEKSVQSESTLVQNSIKVVWNIVSNFKKLINISPAVGDGVEYEEDLEKTGSIAYKGKEIKLKLCNQEKWGDLKVVEVNTQENQKRNLILEVIGGIINF